MSFSEGGGAFLAIMFRALRSVMSPRNKRVRLFAAVFSSEGGGVFFVDAGLGWIKLMLYGIIVYTALLGGR